MVALPARLGRLWPLEVAAVLALLMSVAGYWTLSETLLARYLFAALALVATVLALLKKDRILFGLLLTFAAGYSLLSLLFAQVLPVFVVFPTLAVLGSIALSFVEVPASPVEWATRTVGGLSMAELSWILTPWPLDPASKAAILALFFYGLVNLLILFQQQGAVSRRAYGWFWFWILATLSVIVFTAEWQL